MSDDFLRSTLQRPSPLKPPPEARTGKEWLDRAADLVNSRTFTKEDSARFDAYMHLFVASRQSNFDRELYLEARQKQDAVRRLDPAVLQFFSGKSPAEPVISENGTKLEARSGARSDRGGAVAELRTY